MFLGLPIVAYGVDYNKETTENACDYFSDADELSVLISQNDETSLLSMGDKMAEIASRRYRWEVIAGQYEGLFD